VAEPVNKTPDYWQAPSTHVVVDVLVGISVEVSIHRPQLVKVNANDRMLDILYNYAKLYQILPRLTLSIPK
jgi:hypothetical protein